MQRHSGMLILSRMVVGYTTCSWVVALHGIALKSDDWSACRER